jgi:hypothetical protein
MITHPLAAPQRRLPLQQSSVVMDASPPCLAGRKQLRKLLIVEGCPMLSPDQSQTVIIRPRPARWEAPGHAVTSV